MRIQTFLKVRFDGSRARHGMRKHGSPVSNTYRRYSAKIVTAMAQALADHPACVGWQVDNEMGGVCFSAESLQKFQQFYARFGTILALNAAGSGILVQA